MKDKTSGTYEPSGKPKPVVSRGEFIFASAFFDHSHVYGQT